MRTGRFWAMERQIDRIKSEDDLRLLNVQMGVNSSEGPQRVVDRLLESMGEVRKVEHNVYVKPERDKHAKLTKLMGQMSGNKSNRGKT